MMKTIFGWLYWKFELIWKNSRLFAFNNRTVFEILFIVLYALLQIALILFVDVYPTKIFLILSVFAILVLSLFALHKLLMESRIKLLENRVNELTLEKQEILSMMRELYGKYDKIQTESIVKSKNLYKQRRD